MRPISNSPEILLAQALGNHPVQTTTGARLTTHNALTIGGVSVRLGAVMVCFWNASGISVIVEAGRSVYVVRSDEKQPFSAHLHGEQPGNNELISLPEVYGLLP